MSCRKIGSFLLALAFIPAGGVWGQRPPEAARQHKLGPEAAEWVLGRWKGEIAAIDRLIREGKPRRALRDADRLTEEIIERVFSSELTGQYLGVLGHLRALAAYGIGDERLALWHWHVGLQLFPELAAHDLAL